MREKCEGFTKIKRKHTKKKKNLKEKKKRNLSLDKPSQAHLGHYAA
jgi:hypothetical protein